jgi:hypothetical protein
MKVFVSYSHKQEKQDGWVRDCLVPCLAAGGARVLLDLDEFKAGRPPRAQSDQAQAEADRQVLVLSPAYFDSEACRHEFAVAVAGTQERLDRGETSDEFRAGHIIPVRRVDFPLPAVVEGLDAPLSPDMVDPAAGPGTAERALEQTRLEQNWDLLLEVCGADLGTLAPHWLDVRNWLRRCLERNQSVHLRVVGNPQWKELLDHLSASVSAPELHQVDVGRGATELRHDLLSEMLGQPGSISPSGDLKQFEQALLLRQRVTRVVLRHFDSVTGRETYGDDLFTAWRYLMSEKRQLVVLFQSRAAFHELLPLRLQDSPIAALESMELKGRPRDASI